MDNIENKCITLFNSIDWENLGNGEDYETYIYLFFEFLRRASIFAKDDINIQGPWSIITSKHPEIEISKEAQDSVMKCAKIQNPGELIGQGIYILMVLINFIAFEKARYLGIIASNAKNIYTPLIEMYKLNGEFCSHHGYIEFGDFKSIYIADGRWRQFEKYKPYIEFDEFFDYE